MAYIKEDKFGKIKVQVVNNQAAADLLVYVTKNRSEAKDKDEIWYFGEKSGVTKIKFVDNFGDLKLFYVKSKSQAKWRKAHKLQKRIG